MQTNSAPQPDAPFPTPPALPDNVPLDVLEPSDPERSGGLIPSQGLEWSFVVLAIGVLGLVFFLFKVMEAPSRDTPTYKRESRIAPMDARPRLAPNQPDLGVPTESKERR